MFSYDYCHMRTLEFLKRNGYPTLQYSAHQPQVINKKWYCELIDEYPEITTLGYDEWSTYFNYCAVRHSESYEAVPFVTLSWPNIGGENYGFDQSDYIFENFYKENYYGRGLFAKFKERFTTAEEVISENEEKKSLARNLLEKFNTGRAKRHEFYRSYEAQFNELPHFSVYFYGGKNQVPVLGCPVSYRLSRNYLNKI